MEFSLKNKKGNRLHAVLEGDSDKLFILFHGMFGHSDTDYMKIFRGYLMQRGYSILCFDYSGHGKSHGRLHDQTITSVISDADAVIMHARKKYKDIFLFGISFGAYPAIICASKYKIKGIILLNPATDMIELIFRRSTQKDLKRFTKKHTYIPLLTKVKFLFDALNYNIYAAAKKIDCPVYVYHVESDMSVPAMQSRKLDASLKTKKHFEFDAEDDNHGLSNAVRSGKITGIILKNAVDWIELA